MKNRELFLWNFTGIAIDRYIVNFIEYHRSLGFTFPFAKPV